MEKPELQKLSLHNLTAVLGLQVRPEQKKFVASNLESLFDLSLGAIRGRWVRAFALCVGKRPVGFVLLQYDGKAYELWRLMIGREFQGRGYGKKAMEQILSYLQTFPAGPAEVCRLSYEPENRRARGLYHGFGFRETGERDQGEIVAIRKL